MKKKIKEQLKADKFVALINRTFQLAKSRTKELAVAGAGIVIVVAAFLGIRYIQTQGAKQQSQILADIIRLSDEIEQDSAKLNELEKLEGNGRFSRLAFVKIAAHAFEKEDWGKALSALDNIPTQKKDIIYYQAMDLKAQVYAAQRKYDQALSVYLEMEEENPEDYALDVILFHKAEILLEKGEQEEALALFNRIKEDFPQTYYGYEASQKVVKLEEKK